MLYNQPANKKRTKGGVLRKRRTSFCATLFHFPCSRRAARVCRRCRVNWIVGRSEANETSSRRKTLTCSDGCCWWQDGLIGQLALYRRKQWLDECLRVETRRVESALAGGLSVLVRHAVVFQRYALARAVQLMENLSQVIGVVRHGNRETRRLKDAKRGISSNFCCIQHGRGGT